jgi:hypothetical protein
LAYDNAISILHHRLAAGAGCTVQALTDLLYRDLWHTGGSEEVIELGHFVSLSALLAKGEDGALLRPREGDKESGDAFRVSGGVGPPSPIIEANKDDGIVLQTLALMDGHHGDLTDPLECVEASSPVRRAIGASEEVDAKSFKDDLKLVTNAVFSIGSGDRIEIQIVKNPSG